MLLGFVSFKRPPLKTVAISDADLAKCIATAGPLVCGISQEVSLGEGDLAVRQAMAALRTAEREDAGIVRWTTLRFDAFRAAARSDRLYARAADLLRSLLFDYDAEHDADLGATAEAFARRLWRGEPHGRGAVPTPEYRALSPEEDQGSSLRARRDRPRVGRPARAGVSCVARLLRH